MSYHREQTFTQGRYANGQYGPKRHHVCSSSSSGGGGNGEAIVAGGVALAAALAAGYAWWTGRKAKAEAVEAKADAKAAKAEAKRVAQLLEAQAAVLGKERAAARAMESFTGACQELGQAVQEYALSRVAKEPEPSEIFSEQIVAASKQLRSCAGLKSPRSAAEELAALSRETAALSAQLAEAEAAGHSVSLSLKAHGMLQEMRAQLSDASRKLKQEMLDGGISGYPLWDVPSASGRPIENLLGLLEARTTHLVELMQWRSEQISSEQAVEVFASV